MKIITISREFGSGGRELGKRLADALGFNYYDTEIIREIAKECLRLAATKIGIHTKFITRAGVKI